jgi:hypothetical protein
MTSSYGGSGTISRQIRYAINVSTHPFSSCKEIPEANRDFSF